MTNTAGDLLLVGIDTNGDGDSASSVTYNGVAMTQTLKWNSTTGTWQYLYSLRAPATGTHNVVYTFTATGSNEIIAAVSYSGTNQSSFPDASGTGSATSPAISVTTVSDNAWIGAFVRNDTQSAGASTVKRTSATNLIEFYDNNAPVHPAGSATINVTTSGPGMYIKYAIAPATASATNSNFFEFM